MDKFLKRKISVEEPVANKETTMTCDSSSNLKKPHLEINLDDLPSDPRLRRKISIIILTIVTRKEWLICKKDLVNLLTIIFHKKI